MIQPGPITKKRFFSNDYIEAHDREHSWIYNLLGSHAINKMFNRHGFYYKAFALCTLKLQGLSIIFKHNYIF